jgi:hypothetical protein
MDGFSERLVNSTGCYLTPQTISSHHLHLSSTHDEVLEQESVEPEQQEFAVP